MIFRSLKANFKGFFFHCRLTIIAKDSSNTGCELKWLKPLFSMLTTLTEVVCKNLCVCVCLPF